MVLWLAEAVGVAVVGDLGNFFKMSMHPTVRDEGRGEGLASSFRQICPGAAIDEPDRVSACLLDWTQDDHDILGEEAQRPGFFHLGHKIDEGLGE